ncbi:hypothetical protein ES708_18821 [subsurface metagenome]
MEVGSGTGGASNSISGSVSKDCIGSGTGGAKYASVGSEGVSLGGGEGMSPGVKTVALAINCSGTPCPIIRQARI